MSLPDPRRRPSSGHLHQSFGLECIDCCWNHLEAMALNEFTMVLNTKVGRSWPLNIYINTALFDFSI